MSDPDGPSDGFLARWSRRKRAAVAPADDAEAGHPAVAPPEAGVPGVSPEPAPEPEFDVSTLPTLDELTAETDIRGFLQHGVPEALKNAALRKAWALDPFLRDYIGPVENGYNFNDPASIPGFGEMDVRVDTRAMLRQIMGEKDPDAAISEAPVPAAASGSLPVALENDSPESPSPGDEKSLCGDAAADENDAALHNNAVEIIDEKPPIRRNRRHGGAIPD